jgi:hypothetical protein
MRLGQRQTHDFVFAYERNMRGVRVEQGLDGDVAFNVQGGRAVRQGEAALRARRLEVVNNPIGILKAALDPAARLGNLRREESVQTVDIVTAAGDRVTLAVDATTNLPAWVSWVQPNANLGDLTLRTHFTGYQLENGILMPSGYNTVSDFRNVVQQKLYVDRTYIDDASIEAPAAAPEAVRAAAVPGPPTVIVEVVPVAKGIWYLKGQGNSTAFEFSDHITLFEAYGSEANAKAIIDMARTLVPGKPVTQVIVSHHHFDHSGGLRTAVAEGLEVITQRGNAGIFEEMTSRPATLFPDALGRSPKPLRLVPVDDKLVLKDETMEVQVLRVINNSHMANGLLAYAPSAKVVAQGDLVDEGWDIVFWGNSYPDSVKFWKLDVERDLAVHGNINPYSRSLELLRQQAANAKGFCDTAERENYAIPGCPATNVGF